ncbi:MAG TPA: Rieske 2Fe-2S domain-containing protein [Terriglobia bacterium]|nr:Rieske 2Fe-2S domain-containing protein [Terriglobia bacterium]
MAETITLTRINLGSATAIPLGQGRCYVVGGQEIAVFRQRDGRLFATENRCPHRRGPLSEGIVGDGRVICPMHAHQFNLQTGTGSEVHECLNVFEIEEADGNLMLNMEQVLA